MMDIKTKTKKIKLSKRTKKKLIIILMLIIVIGIILLIINANLKRDDKKITIKTESYEEFADTICELATYSYTHNSITPHYDTKGAVDYYARYNGQIQYGIKDASKVSISSEKDKIIIKLPKLEQLSCQAVVQDTLFLGEEREGIAGEATEICTNNLIACATDDLQLEAGISMIDDAKESTERMITGLFSSFANDKNVEIQWEDGNEK